MRMRIKAFWNKYGRVGFILVLLGAIVSGISLFAQPEPAVPLSSLQPLSLAGVHRLLIFAPHCDDETLGTGGLILAARRQGIQVKVVILTNGDGFFFATIRDFKKVYPRPTDYIRLGKMRQQESLAALSLLGINSSDVIFLSYPDRGTPALWNTDWSPQKPYRSPYSGDTQSPYPLTYDPKAVYAGQDLLGDITSILDSYQPEMIVYPHPADVHPDHWGLSVFVRLALELKSHADPSFRPAQYTYLVHRPDYPDVKGLRPGEPLTPPEAIYASSPKWFRLDMPKEDTALKGEAVLKYTSQLTLLRTLMESFVRSNELFASAQDVPLPALAQGQPDRPSTWMSAEEQAIKPVQLDPVGDFITRSAVPASDLVAEYAARDSKGNLHFCVQARQATLPEFTYSLRLKALTSKGIIFYDAHTAAARSPWHPATRTGPYVCASVSLSELGNPWAVYMGANVVGGGRIVDEVAWQMVILPGAR